MTRDSPFTQRVYEVVRQIPAGKVMTYQDVASDGRMLGVMVDGVSSKEGRLRAEGVPITNGRFDLAVCRWQTGRLDLEQ